MTFLAFCKTCHQEPEPLSRSISLALFTIKCLKVHNAHTLLCQLFGINELEYYATKQKVFTYDDMIVPLTTQFAQWTSAVLRFVSQNMVITTSHILKMVWPFHCSTVLHRRQQRTNQAQYNIDSSTAWCQLSCRKCCCKHSASIHNRYHAEPKLRIPNFLIALVYSFKTIWVQRRICILNSLK